MAGKSRQVWARVFAHRALTLNVLALIACLVILCVGSSPAQTVSTYQRVDATGNVFVNTGGQKTTTIAAAGGTVVVSGAPTRLVSILITTAGTASITCYDNASTASGTVIGVTPATTTVGTLYSFNEPAASGITCSDPAGGPAVTVAFN